MQWSYDLGETSGHCNGYCNVGAGTLLCWKPSKSVGLCQFMSKVQVQKKDVMEIVVIGGGGHTVP